MSPIYALGCGSFVELRRASEAPQWFKDQVTKPMKKRITKFVALTEEEKTEYNSLKGLPKEAYAMKNGLRYDYDYSVPAGSSPRPTLGKMTSKFETIQVPIVSATGWDGGEVITSMPKRSFHILTGISLGAGESLKMAVWSQQ